MYIYHQRPENKISYSVKQNKGCKKYISLVKKVFINRKKMQTGIYAGSAEVHSLSKDRQQQIILGANQGFIRDIGFKQRIFTQTNLSLIANQRSFYNVQNRHYFKIFCPVVPFTYTQQYLDNIDQYNRQWLQINIYRKNFIVKLGFFGTYSSKLTYKMRSIIFLKDK